MANRYWVGGSGNWSDNINHWSASSGGVPGASLPTLSDNVFVDSNSGLSNGTLTLDFVGTPTCNNFVSSTGFSYTIVRSVDMDIYGSLTYESTIIFSGVGFINFRATTTGNTITSTGLMLGGCNFSGIGGGWTLQSNLTCIGEFYIENGTFDANGHNVTANDFFFFADVGLTPTINMGSGTWTTSSDWGVQEEDGQLVIINPGTSTIKMLNSNGENYFYQNTGITFGAYVRTYYNLWITKNGSNLVDMTGSVILNNLTIDAGAKLLVDTISATDLSDTITVSSFTAVGTSGNLITLNTYDGTGTFNLIKLGGGTVSCDYLSVGRSVATPSNTWYAGTHSTDGGNNSGWIFTAPPLYTNQVKNSSTFSNQSKNTSAFSNQSKNTSIFTNQSKS